METYGKLSIKIAVHLSDSRGRLVQVYCINCQREDAKRLADDWRELNPRLVAAIAQITWQADMEWVE